MSNIILIADDEPWQRMWLSHVLHTAGFTCSTVVDGSDVIEQALALSPSLIIMDIEMPTLSGIEAAAQLRILPPTRDLPILFVTGHAACPTETIVRCAYLRKPFQPAELLARVQQLLCAG